MKTIALISGGKDSILAMLMGYRFGHEPAVLVNMMPELPTEDDGAGRLGEGGHDIDSYMYQTVGFEVVEGIATCLGLPLRRGCVPRGRAKDRSLLYSEHPPAEDEVESLFHLIKAVKAEFPDVQGLTSGAILSNYQRNRVEFVCDRLGIESLAYLWMREPEEILDMATTLRVSAILVKTASIGLWPRRLIGRTLEEARPTLEKMRDLYQAHLAGEGGEYETTVLNCPLYRSEQLVVTSLEVVMQDDNEISPSGHGIFTIARQAKTVEQLSQETALLKHLQEGSLRFPSDVLPLLRILSSSSAMPLDKVSSPLGCAKGAVGAKAPLRLTQESLFLLPCLSRYPTEGMMHDFITVHVPRETEDTSLEEAQAMVVRSLETLLSRAAEQNLTPFYFHFCLPHPSWEMCCRTAYATCVSHVCPPGLLITTLTGRSNADWASSFAVPADVAVAAVQVELLAAPSFTIGQQVLHAQSRSCWALGEPGPYAQGRRVGLPSGSSFTLVGATPGRVPATRAVATCADVPELCVSHIAAYVTRCVGEDNTADALDFVAQFLYAVSNCERYLAIFKRGLRDVAYATIIATADAPLALLHPLWQWCSTGGKNDACETTVDVVVVGCLSCKERVRVVVECMEEGEESLL